MDKVVDSYGLVQENNFLTCFMPALNKALVFRVKSRVNKDTPVFNYGPLPLASGEVLPTLDAGSVSVPADGVMPARAYVPTGRGFPLAGAYDSTDMWYIPEDYRERIFHVIQKITPAFLRVDVQIPKGVTQGRFQRDKVITGVDRDLGFARGVIETVQLPRIHYGYRWCNDSVPGYSPVIVKFADGSVDILPLEDLWEMIPSQPYIGEPKGEGVEEIKDVPFELYTYSPYHWHRWTRVKRVIRHPFEGELIRIRTVGGVVDVTPNHSLFKRVTRLNGKSTVLVNAAEIKPGDKIRMVKLEPLTTPSWFVGTEDLAWLYGVFAAEGTATGDSMKIYNKDLELLEKARAIAELNFHQRITTVHPNSHASPSIAMQRRLAYEHFKGRFYTRDGKKRVPKEILNAPTRIKSAFLRGYDEGDGSHRGRGNPKEFEMFTTNSWTLAMGLLWLMRGVSDQSWSIWTRGDKPDVVQIQFTAAPYTVKPKKLPDGRWLEDRETVKSVTRVPYKGYVYDLDTENGKFVTGVGGIVVHNTNLSVYTFVKFIYGEYVVETPMDPGLIFDILTRRVQSHWVSLPISVWDPGIESALMLTYGFTGFTVYAVNQRDRALREYGELLGRVKV